MIQDDRIMSVNTGERTWSCQDEEPWRCRVLRWMGSYSCRRGAL